MEAVSLRGRVAVVTGAGRGIGRVVADHLASHGMSLLLLARTGAQVRAVADEVVERHGVACLPAAIDVTDVTAVERVLLHAEQHLGTVDVLVNNAAVIDALEVPFWESDLDEVWRVIHNNLRGPLVMTRALLPAMIQRGRGHVVNVTTRARAASRTGTYTGYAVSKRGLSVFTESLASSLAGSGVVVIDVLPGLVRTPMTEAMPAWRGVTEWDDAAATATVIADVARGRYDDRAGTVLDAVELASSGP
jgi:NAD(P)-dependent dehydrogenase (short-subunit alcohol dehydrogenase family)